MRWSGQCEALQLTSIKKRYQLPCASCVVIELTAISHCEIGVVGRDEKENEVETHDQRHNTRPWLPSEDGKPPRKGADRQSSCYVGSIGKVLLCRGVPGSRGGPSRGAVNTQTRSWQSRSKKKARTPLDSRQLCGLSEGVILRKCSKTPSPRIHCQIRQSTERRKTLG
jgi:hypothetical protein